MELNSRNVKVSFIAALAIAALGVSFKALVQETVPTSHAQRAVAGTVAWCTESDLSSLVTSGTHYPTTSYVNGQVVPGEVNLASTEQHHSATVILRNASSERCLLPSDVTAVFYSDADRLPLQRAGLGSSLACAVALAESAPDCFGRDRLLAPGESAYVWMGRIGCADRAYTHEGATELQLGSYRHNPNLRIGVRSNVFQEFRACSPGHDVELEPGDVEFGLLRTGIQ